MEPNIVFSFIPNVIGYVRIVLYAVGFIAHVVGYWQCCLVFYLVAFFLDELDGLAAKKFNQQSQFGAALDMVTDRAATTGFCLIISQLYPSYLLGFILLITLDISSHYYLLQASSIQVDRNHKNTERWSQNRLLNLYYGNKRVMDILIVGNELFYILLYLSYYLQKVELFAHSLQICQLMLWVISPIYLVKQITNVVQLQASATCIAIADAQNHKT